MVVVWLASTFTARWTMTSVRVTVTESSWTSTSWELCTDAISRSKSTVCDSWCTCRLDCAPAPWLPEAGCALSTSSSSRGRFRRSASGSTTIPSFEGGAGSAGRASGAGKATMGGGGAGSHTRRWFSAALASHKGRWKPSAPWLLCLFSALRARRSSSLSMSIGRGGVLGRGTVPGDTAGASAELRAAATAVAAAAAAAAASAAATTGTAGAGVAGTTAAAAGGLGCGSLLGGGWAGPGSFSGCLAT